MWDSINSSLEQIVSWKIFIFLVVLFIICSFGFRQRYKVIGTQIKLFDIRFGYTPAQANELLGEIGEKGRRVYIITQLTLDLVFPFVYTGLTVIFFFILYKNPNYLLIIPLITFAADLLENITTVYLAWSYKAVETPVAWVACAFTVTKRLGLTVSLIIILVGIITDVTQKWFSVCLCSLKNKFREKELFFGLRPPMCGKAMLFRRCSPLLCGFAAILRSINVCSGGKKSLRRRIWRRSRKEWDDLPGKA